MTDISTYAVDAIWNLNMRIKKLINEIDQLRHENSELQRENTELRAHLAKYDALEQWQARNGENL